MQYIYFKYFNKRIINLFYYYNAKFDEYQRYYNNKLILVIVMKLNAIYLHIINFKVFRIHFYLI